MSRPIDAYALIEKARFEARGMKEPFRSSFAVTVAWLVEKMPTIEPEITQEDIELYCRRRCLTVITDDLYNEMKMRWSAQPEKCEDCGNFNKTQLLIPQPEQKTRSQNEKSDKEDDH